MIDKHFPWKRAAIDSRDVGKGDLFFALKGEKVDGHQFLSEVAKQGGAAAVVFDDYHGPSYGLHLFKVSSPLETLQQLSKEKLNRSSTRVVALTGSLGKTTTKTFLHTILDKRFHVAVAPKNYNSQIGVPLTILNHFNGNEEILILEMGMTGPGEIEKLVEIAPPEIALITSIDAVHVGNFEGLEGIAEAKGEILTHPKTKWALLPQSLPFLERLIQIGTCKKRLFSTSEEVSLPVLGCHNQYNFACAQAVAAALGMSDKEIAERIPYLKLPEKRLEEVEKGGVRFINDSYNACVTSMKGALDSLPQPTHGAKKVAVLGAMVELGNHSETAHKEVGEYALERVDRLVAYHHEAKPMLSSWNRRGKKSDYFENQKELLSHLRMILNPGDVVLLKGSNVRQLWKIAEEF